MSKNNSGDKEKKIPFKNYVILGALFIFGMALTIYLCNWYKVYDDYQKQIPIIRGTLSEITTEELDHYVLENPTTVIYMCTASDYVCRNYEKDFKKLVENNNLQDTIIYLNLSNVNISEFVDNFNNSYNYKVKLTSSYPALVIFEEGRVVNLLQGSDEEALTVTKTKQFIDINKIGE